MNSFLDEIHQMLSRHEKAAEAASEQGAVQNQGDSGTTHPSKSVDDATRTATTGARAAENKADVEANVPSSVEEQVAEVSSGSEMTGAKATGEDPANETASASPYIGGEAGKDHTGADTTHPAKADFGEKYSSVDDCAADVIKRCNSFFAKISALQAPSNKATATATAAAARSDTKAAAIDTDELAGAQAAEDVIAAAGGFDPDSVVDSVIKEAVADADALVSFYAGVINGKKDVNEAAKNYASDLFKSVKSAMDDPNTEGVANLTSENGDGAPVESAELPAESEAAPANEGDDIIDQIVQELVAAGIDPQVLASIPPEDLAHAIMQATSDGGEVMDAAPATETLPVGAV